jgi:Rrf2 family transcriptional regulator, nitric oxide-sensitive transcriptional repressor
MKITAFADVGLRVLMVVAAREGDQPVSTRDISAIIETPYNHVSKTVTRLGDLGHLRVVRGRSGGVLLSDQGRAAMVGQVLRELDTHEDPAACHSPNGDCPLLPGCTLRTALRRAREAFYRELDDLPVTSLRSERLGGATFGATLAVGVDARTS